MRDGDTARPQDSTDPAAAMALGQAGADPASARSAEAYLQEATRLARLQIAELEDGHVFHRVHHFSAVMKAAFEGLVALLVLAIVIAIAAAVWNAAHDEGLVIQSFSVPSEMRDRGLTGHVVAARLLDKLSQLQAQTVSNRAASSYANNWGGDIKVQIPETGVSIGQINAYLHEWLGNQTQISGEIYRDAAGKLAVTARVGSEGGQTFHDPEADLDALLQKTAEAIYRKTQPYRYAVYLTNTGRTARNPRRCIVS